MKLKKVHFTHRVSIGVKALDLSDTIVVLLDVSHLKTITHYCI